VTALTLLLRKMHQRFRLFGSMANYLSTLQRVA